MPSKRILVCGAGIAGSTLAFWLSKYDFEVLVVERSSSEFTAGQGIDIEGPGFEIVKLMGILDQIKSKTTGEVGVAIVDEQDQPCGVFDVDDAGSISLTRSIEIMRGDLAEIIVNAANGAGNVTFQFDTTIKSIRQTQEYVAVELEDKARKSTRSMEFDVVVGADGVRSHTRQLSMGTPEQLNCLKPVGGFCAFFSVPKEDKDWPRSRVCQFTERRSICIRPRSESSKTTSVYLSQFRADNPSLLKALDAGNRQMQKEAFAEVFSGLGWETPRVVKEMMRSENFYFDFIMQVKLEKWSQDRVVLIGDAAYAPSPLTGQGTVLAILGAYVLAQELSRNRDDESMAFKKYETRLRSYVENSQSIPLGGYLPFMLNPQTSWGVWLCRKIVAFITWTKLSKILPAPKAAEFDLETTSEKE